MSVLKRTLFPFLSLTLAVWLLVLGTTGICAWGQANAHQRSVSTLTGAEAKERQGKETESRETLEPYTFHFFSFKIQQKQLFSEPFIWDFLSGFKLKLFVIGLVKHSFVLFEQVCLATLPQFFVVFRYIISANAP